MRDQALTHRSTRAIKIEQLQEAFSTDLPPTLLLLDLLRTLLDDVFKVEGFGTRWKTGDEPPAEVKAWWGEDDIDILKMYTNQNLPKPLMDLIREWHLRFKRNDMMYWREKLVNCYRLGEGMHKFHMELPTAEVKEVKRERLRREEEERNARRAAAEAELEEEQQRQMQEEFDARVEKAVQERERRRQATRSYGKVA